MSFSLQKELEGKKGLSITHILSTTSMFDGCINLILFNPKLREAYAQAWFVFISRFVSVCLKLVLLIQPNVSQLHSALVVQF